MWNQLFQQIKRQFKRWFQNDVQIDTYTCAFVASLQYVKFDSHIKDQKLHIHLKMQGVSHALDNHPFFQDLLEVTK
jgi:hypothetical protein